MLSSPNHSDDDDLQFALQLSTQTTGNECDDDYESPEEHLATQQSLLEDEVNTPFKLFNENEKTDTEALVDFTSFLALVDIPQAMIEYFSDHFEEFCQESMVYAGQLRRGKTFNELETEFNALEQALQDKIKTDIQNTIHRETSEFNKFSDLISTYFGKSMTLEEKAYSLLTEDVLPPSPSASIPSSSSNNSSSVSAISRKRITRECSSSSSSSSSSYQVLFNERPSDFDSDIEQVHYLRRLEAVLTRAISGTLNYRSVITDEGKQGFVKVALSADLQKYRLELRNLKGLAFSELCDLFEMNLREVERQTNNYNAQVERKHGLPVSDSRDAKEQRTLQFRTDTRSIRLPEVLPSSSSSSSSLPASTSTSSSSKRARR